MNNTNVHFYDIMQTTPKREYKTLKEGKKVNPILFNNLLSRYRSSPKAVTKLYEYYYPLIVRYIDRQFRGKVDGKDIAQQFFIKLFEIKPKFVRAPTAWVYTVVRNMALDKMRKDKRLIYTEKENRETETIYLSDKVSLALSGLTDIEQKIIYLRYWERFRLKEIAELLNEKYDAVKYHHRIAKNKLKNHFREEEK